MMPTTPDTVGVRVGCVFRPHLSPTRLADAARIADVSGLDELWLWEDCFLTGGIASAAIALSHSSQLTVGIGVLPVPLRNPAITAMEIATLARAYPYRLRVGLGHGVQDWMRQIGAKVGSPMTLLREHLTCVVALLQGQNVSFQGRYVRLDDVKLDWAPGADSVEILAGAGGPKTLQLSGELTSGTILTGGTTPDDVRAALSHIAEGRAAALFARRHAIVSYVPCATGPDAEQQIAREIAEWGFDPQSDVAAYGTATEIATAATRWIDAGADTIALQPTGDADVERFIEFVATQVKPLIAGRR